MKTRSFLLVIFALAITVNSNAQSSSIYETPRILVYGESSVQVEPEVIVAYLNIYDNAVAYDNTVPYDAKKSAAKMINAMDKMNCREFLVSPTSAELKNYVGSGPFEMRFTTKEQFEMVRGKAAMNSTEELSMSLDYSTCSISNEKRAQLKNQMLDQALADAKAKADRMAKGLGVVLGTPIYVEEVNEYGGYAYDTGYAESVSMKVTVTARVQIQYQLK